MNPTPIPFEAEHPEAAQIMSDIFARKGKLRGKCFLDGEVVLTSEIPILGKNSLCPCKSGKKVKHCHPHYSHGL